MRSRACGVEEVKSTASSAHVGVDWHPPNEVGRRGWDRARGAGCPEKPGLGGGDHSAPHSTTHSFSSTALQDDDTEVMPTASRGGLLEFSTQLCPF